MRKGTDEFGIESICEVADPLIIDNKTGNNLTPENFKKKETTNGNLIIHDKNITLQNSDSNASIFDIFK
jgi:hypothetical protein